MTSTTTNTGTTVTPASGRILEGKVAIVLGGSRGIGAATAAAFAAAGAKVVVAARDSEALHRVAATIRQDGGEARAVPADMGDAGSLERLVNETVATFGRLDVALNNAADGVMPTPLAGISADDFERTVRVNLVGFFVAMKYEISAMLQGGGGAIVNTGSTVSVAAWAGLAPYASTKHAIVGLSKTAALDYAARNIRVNVVAPGPIGTERIAALTDEQRAPIAANVPMGRIGRPEEVAALVTWLCSEQASFITGAVVPIDGGQLARA